VTAGKWKRPARLSQAHDFIEQHPQRVRHDPGRARQQPFRRAEATAGDCGAIVFNPRILVLDDATAAVDPETEDLIRRAMKFVMYGTDHVHHPHPSAREAGRSGAVMEEGRITQMGNARPAHGAGRPLPPHRPRASCTVTTKQQPLKVDLSASPSHMKRVGDQQTVAAAKLGATPLPSPAPVTEQSGEQTL